MSEENDNNGSTELITQPPTVKPLSQRQILAALQLAMGKTAKEVAEGLEVTPITIGKWKTSPRFRLAISEATKEVKNRMIDDHEEKIKQKLNDEFDPSLEFLAHGRNGIYKPIRDLHTGEELVPYAARQRAAEFLVKSVIDTSVTKRTREADDPSKHRAIINLPPQLAKVLVQAIAEDDNKTTPVDVTEESEEI